MKIWLDFINTPQVAFFVPFIRRWESDGHELLLTCRDSGNTVGLLRQHGLAHHVVGKRVGTGTFDKAQQFAGRMLALYRFVRTRRPDVAAGQSSFYLPLIAKLLGVPSLYTNDNEHAQGNFFGFRFATKVFLPEPLRGTPATQKPYLQNRLRFYPGVKEAIYLSQQPDLLAAIDEPKRQIYFRPEPWSAQYYDGPLNFFDEALRELAKEYEIVVLPRDKNQADHYRQPEFAGVRVPDGPLKLRDIVSGCLLFIGAGGSMTRELAVLGVPVVSIYQADLLAVDEYLVDRGLLHVDPQLDYAGIQKLLSGGAKKPRDRSVLETGGVAFHLILKNIHDLRAS
ncbi:DUF354 domain-containing protein [Neolewinella antarctica]|uniref:DUF354 domain-containing protein n=1 Tax=Neolewinella antarctica TaxID=442734 RepID=A0ABX0X9D5_9BACT|nr:DUF354 domain-containing protein [Neolewinella antarctica]NJC25876.1 hypothetical protein [Neolewinella antarctica]